MNTYKNNPKNQMWNHWSTMQQRLINESHRAYKYYGGRGIKCRWETYDDFKADMYLSFLEHAVEYGFKETQLDRIDSNGNYCKENCRWATRMVQQHNRRTTKVYTFKGETKTVKQWSDYLGITYDSLIGRLDKYEYAAGIDLEKLASTPKYHKFKFEVYNGTHNCDK